MKEIRRVSIGFLLILAACSNNAAPMPYEEEKISQETLKGNKDFAFDLFHKLREEGQNVFISPYSISLVLSMVLTGAEDETEEEIRKSLHYQGIEDKTILNTFQHYTAYLTHAKNEVEIDSANSVWVDEGFDVKEEYKSKVVEQLRAEVFQQELSDEAIVEDMNSWINNHTNGMIEKLINNPYHPNARLLLTNAVYFNGKWEHPFEEKLTMEDVFHKADGSEQTVEFMNQNEKFDYFEEGSMKAVRLPYSESYSMYVMLPTGQKLSELIQGFDATSFRTMKDHMEKEEVHLSLPKFHLVYGKKDLEDTLQSLGIRRLFEGADLSGISDSALQLDEVHHKAVLDVSEHGTEAAAVTQVSTYVSGVADLKTLQANRPFFYIIADDQHDSILFMGTYEGIL